MSEHSTLEELRVDIQDLKAQQEFMRDESVECTVAVNLMRQRLAHIDRELFGNGQPGLVKSVAKIQQQLRVAIWLVTTIAAIAGSTLATVLTN